MRLVKSKQFVPHGQTEALNFFQSLVQLLVKLFETFVSPGGAVLDIFGGSGTSIVAGIQAGVSVHLVEINVRQWRGSVERIQGHLNRGAPFFGNELKKESKSSSLERSPEPTGGGGLACGKWS